MDIRTGRTYDSREAARAAGVPESDIAEVVIGPDDTPAPRFTEEVVRGTGPFRGRLYRRDRRTGNLVRVK